MADRTKKLLAAKLQELAKTKAIRDIQVRDLCALCEIDRTTFYYHFRDKYDLVSWIFQQHFVEEAARADTVNDERMISAMFRRLYAQRDFFRNALRDDSQNNLRQYVLDLYIGSEKAAACAYLGTERLDAETLYEIRSYSHGCMGMTVDWLLGRADFTPEQMGHFQYKFMPELLKKAYRNATK